MNLNENSELEKLFSNSLFFESLFRLLFQQPPVDLSLCLEKINRN